MTRPATLKLLFNASGVVIGLILIGYIFFSGFLPEDETSCHERYPSTTRLSLHSSQGAPLSSIELQARAGAGEWGVGANASVVPQGEDGAALKVKLATLSDVDGDTQRAANGVNFIWRMAALAKAQSACLSYSVWLPEGFAFGDGGVLPGLLGGVPGDTGDSSRFATRAHWSGTGLVGLDAALPGAGFRSVSSSSGPLAPGRWTRIDQEVSLNAPGKTDGQVRMWIDGMRAGEAKDLVLRKDAASQFVGVSADIGYLRDPAKPSELRLTPFELSWR